MRRPRKAMWGFSARHALNEYLIKTENENCQASVESVGPMGGNMHYYRAIEIQALSSAPVTRFAFST